jgi:hypothetical protein
MKKNLVLGASLKPERYSHQAVLLLRSYGHEVAALGLREGSIGDVTVQKGKPVLEGIDTVTLYLNPQRQPEFYDYLMALHPRRIIFNPGTENPELIRLAQHRGIETEIACTLVMLRTGQF